MKKYDDQHVLCTYVYAKANDAYAYSDSATKLKITAAELTELFENGLVIVNGTTKYKAVSYSVAGGVGTLTYVTADGTTATTAVLATLKSKEYTAE